MSLLVVPTVGPSRGETGERGRDVLTSDPLSGTHGSEERDGGVAV